MARKPRNDGKLYRHGKDRPGGQRPWRVAAYRASAEHPNGRVRFKLVETGQWTWRLPDADAGETLDQLFDRIETALDTQVALGAGNSRTMRLLAARYQEWLKALGRADTYLLKVANILDKWVLAHELPDGRLLGDLPVADWNAEHSAAVIARVREHCGPQRVEDAGVALSGLRKTAHRKVQGGRWLALEDNPMEGVKYGRSSGTVGQHKNFVEPSKRPSDKQVAAAVEAARLRGEQLGMPWLWLMVAVACRTGLRLGELLALRATDVLPGARELSVNGAWCQPRATKTPYRKGTKTGKNRITPYPRSLGAALEERHTEVVSSSSLQALGWLFPAKSGAPWTREAFNDEWHRIVALTHDLAAIDPAAYAQWPRAIPFRNARHYTATWWRQELDFSWEDIASFLGHDVATCLGHYVRQSDDARTTARARLDEA